MICLKKLTFSSHPRAIVKPQEPPSPAELTFETQLFFFQKQQTNTPKNCLQDLDIFTKFSKSVCCKNYVDKGIRHPHPTTHLFLMDEDPGQMTGRTLFSKESGLGPGSVVGGKRQETGKTK